MAVATDTLTLPKAGTRAAEFLQLSKPRLNALVLGTTLGGYYIAGGRTAEAAPLFHTLVGTALVAAGSSAFNQYYERVTDGKMRRTQLRPLPDGRLQPAGAFMFACITSLIGLTQLWLGLNLVAAAVALLALLTYVAVYTPLKRHTPVATLLGAVPGALPPLIGWAAARGTLDPVSWTLFAIGFCWQLPHFLAIAWIYREDYARAGLRMLPVVEPDGRSTGRQAIVFSAALLPISLAPAVFGLAGPLYFVGAFVLGTAFLALAVRFAATRSTAGARRLFLGSVVYLPLIWTLMIADKM